MYEWLPTWLMTDENGNKFNMGEYPYVGGGKNKYSGRKKEFSLLQCLVVETECPLLKCLKGRK